MKLRAMWRSFCFVVLVLVMVHMCGASSTYVQPGVVGWPLGPCTLERFMDNERMVISCLQHDIVQVWPIGVGGLAMAGPPP